MKLKHGLYQIRDLTFYSLALLGTGVLALIPAVLVDAGAQWAGRLA